jgi:hypothetical protein
VHSPGAVQRGQGAGDAVGDVHTLLAGQRPLGGVLQTQAVLQRPVAAERVHKTPLLVIHSLCVCAQRRSVRRVFSFCTAGAQKGTHNAEDGQQVCVLHQGGDRHLSEEGRVALRAWQSVRWRRRGE